MSIKRAGWDRKKGRPEPIKALNLILERESGEELVDFRVFAPSVRLIRASVVPFARRTVVERCELAAQQLPDGVFLGLIEAWRPLKRQQRVWNFMWDCAREAFPERDYVALRRTVCRWVAPTDQPTPPGHCTGAAVDVSLVNEQNEQLDVCSPFTRFTAAATYSLGLTAEAALNRDLLIRVMLEQGFSNCREEFWHYSFGDAGWAVREGKSACIYGLAELCLPEIEELEKLNVAAFESRPNPFLPSLAPNLGTIERE